MACIVIIVSSVCIVIASWYSINKKNKTKKQKKMKSQLFLDFFKWSSG